MKPKLQFPEFVEPYTKFLIDEVYDFGRTNSLSRSDLIEEGLVRNIHYGDIHVKFGNLVDLRKITLPAIINPKPEYNADEIINPGDIVVADAAEDYAGIGRAIEITNTNNEIILSGLHTILLKPRKLTAIGYFGFYMNTDKVHSQIKRIAAGVSVYGISKSNLAKIKLFCPSIVEQQKIADFLTVVDERITLQEKKIELLEKYKKGVMQQIFSQKIRFKDEVGKDFPEWKKYKISELSELEKGSKAVSEMQYLEIGDVNIRNHSYSIESKNKSAVSGAVFVPEGTLLISKVRPDRGAVTISKFDHNVSNAFTRLRVDSNFLFHIVSQRQFLDYLGSLSTGGTYPTCSDLDILDYSFSAPAEAKERLIISNLLDDLDRKINIERRISELAIIFKKGLLQQMFV